MRYETGDMLKTMLKHMWLMLQQKQPEDFVIATGKQHSVKDFINIAANILDIENYWNGKGLKTRLEYLMIMRS